MAATSVLTPGKLLGYSSDIVVNPGKNVLVSLYTAEGTDVSTGPVLQVQLKNLDNNFYNLSTQPYNIVYLSVAIQHLVLATPGTYRIFRPNIENWSSNVGVEILEFNET